MSVVRERTTPAPAMTITHAPCVSRPCCNVLLALPEVPLRNAVMVGLTRSASSTLVGMLIRAVISSYGNRVVGEVGGDNAGVDDSDRHGGDEQALIGVLVPDDVPVRTATITDDESVLLPPVPERRRCSSNDARAGAEPILNSYGVPTTSSERSPESSMNGMSASSRFRANGGICAGNDAGAVIVDVVACSGTGILRLAVMTPACCLRSSGSPPSLRSSGLTTLSASDDCCSDDRVSRRSLLFRASQLSELSPTDLLNHLVRSSSSSASGVVDDDAVWSSLPE